MGSRHEEIFLNEKSGNQKWRCYGEARRKELIEIDVKAGGTCFHLSRDCRIENYFQLAERVSFNFLPRLRPSCPFTSQLAANICIRLLSQVALQFHELCRCGLSDYEDAYIRGYRILIFLSKALPQHPEYQSDHLVESRIEVEYNLRWITRKMNDISNIIDEEQLNSFIMNEYVPQPDDDDEDDDSTFSFTSDNAETGQKSFTGNKDDWETFDGWTSFKSQSIVTEQDLYQGWAFKSQIKTIPGVVETDDSTFSLDTQSFDSEPENHVIEGSSSKLPDPFESDVRLNPLKVSGENRSEKQMYVMPEDKDVPDPEPVLCDSFEEDDDEGECSVIPISYEIMLAVTEARFLRKVAHEDVRFETDSDAADSWAPNNTGFNGSEISAGNEFTCDPARIAFREIMRSLPRSRSIQSNKDLLANSAPSNSPMRSPRRKLSQQHRRFPSRKS